MCTFGGNNGTNRPGPVARGELLGRPEMWFNRPLETHEYLRTGRVKNASERLSIDLRRCARKLKKIRDLQGVSPGIKFVGYSEEDIWFYLLSQ